MIDQANICGKTQAALIWSLAYCPIGRDAGHLVSQ